LNFTKFLFSKLDQRFAKGFMIKARHAFPNPLLLLRALRQPRSADVQTSLGQRVVVIGLGTAALACLKELKREGFSRVTVISRDQLYGGKCVNYGCMPSEFVFATENIPVEERRASLDAFVADLRNDVQKQFDALDYPVMPAVVDRVEGNRVHLADGEPIEFDRLIVAMGNEYPKPAAIPVGLSKLVGIEDFWRLPVGSRVAIYAEGNIFALSLGEIAQRLGMHPAVLLAGVNPFAGLPSYRYFVRGIGKRGVTIHERTRLLRADENELAIEDGGKPVTVPYDYLLVLSKPTPRFPRIDGTQPSIYDVDLNRGSLPSRPEIVFLGDGAGLFTAASAENQARLLMRYWKYGEPLDLMALDATPLCIHGAQSLSLAGPAWTYASRQWKEIDFRSLGWSKIHKLEGKLWYLLNEKTGRIEGLNICHKHANELACLGAALMEYPVWDLKWMTTAMHPTSAEIFKVVAEQALAQTDGSGRTTQLVDDIRHEATFRLTGTADLHPSGNLPEWLTREQCLKAITSRQPKLYFAACFGMGKRGDAKGTRIPFSLRDGEHGEVAVAEPEGVQLNFDTVAKICVVEHGMHRVVVEYCD
jgi:pyruvate/2-oxoglutarate dehydrogenase complex dihydrolipoamide dehydrogenase (E3) component